MPRFWRRRVALEPHFAIFSDVGPVRKRNEDACAAYGPEDGHPGEYLFVVADGMGGHVNGQEASALARDVTFDVFVAAHGSVEQRLERAVQEANRSVWERAHVDGRIETMGTTCTALAFVEERVYVAHVGDSRAYRYDGRKLRLLTRDHTLVDELKRSGAITEEEAKRHPQRNALIRALGIGANVEVDVEELSPLRHGDRFLLCSDGLSPVPQEEIADVLRREDPESACRTLVARAAQAGSTDNATALAVYL